MQRKFILNLILIIFINLLIKPLYVFGIELNVQNVLGSESYGLYYSLFNLSFIFGIINDPGITNFNNRHIAQNEDSLTSSFSSIISTKILLSVLYILAVTVYALSIGFNIMEWKLCGLLVLGQIFNSYTLYNRSNLAGLHLFKTDTFISILDKLIMIVICVPILYFQLYIDYFNIQTFIFIQTISLFGSAVVSFILVKKHTHYFSFNINWSTTKQILQDSYPYAILASLMLVYSKADTVLLKELISNGNEQVGIYAAAYRLIDALNMIAVLFSGLLYPIFAKMIKENLNITPLVKTAFSILVLPALVLAIFTMMNAQPLLEFLSKNHPNDSAEVYKVIIFTFVFICIGYIFGTLLTANGNIKLLNYLALIGVILNISLNVIFIPSYGAIASAWISLITFGTVTLLQAIFCFRYFKFNLKISNLIISALAALIIYMLYYFLDHINIYWVHKIVFGLIGAILILWLSRLLPFRALITLIREK